MANTGRIRYKERDMNPNSPTFGQERWSGYENNTGACPLPQTFFSQAVSGYTTKNNCPTGYTGSQVFYTVPAGYATSPVSQGEADAQAQAFFQNTRQAHANQNGTCEQNNGGGVSPSATPLYNATGCFTCTMQEADGSQRPATNDEVDRYYQAQVGMRFCDPCTGN